MSRGQVPCFMDNQVKSNPQPLKTRYHSSPLIYTSDMYHNNHIFTKQSKAKHFSLSHFCILGPEQDSNLEQPDLPHFSLEIYDFQLFRKVLKLSTTLVHKPRSDKQGKTLVFPVLSRGVMLTPKNLNLFLDFLERLKVVKAR